MTPLSLLSAQSRFLEWSGVSDISRHRGEILLVVAAVVHGTAVAVCVEGGVLFRDGQVWVCGLQTFPKETCNLLIFDVFSALPCRAVSRFRSST